MGQAAKYAILAAALLLVLASVGVIITNFVNPSLFSGISSGISRGLSVVGDAFTNVRGAINYFLGGGAAATAFNVVLWLNIVFSFATFALKLSITIYRWINQ